MTFMIYGVTGYTGKLVSRAAKDMGLDPVLAGRDPQKLRGVAEPLGLDHAAFALSDTAALDRQLSVVDLVLNIAGPFVHSAKPMLDACFRTGTHYADVTGEIDVFETIARRHNEAVEGGITVMPGVGFDVVASDCLAAHVEERLPATSRLLLAFGGMGEMSRGTAKTAIETIDQSSRVRRDGRIVQLEQPFFTSIDFGNGPTECVAISWGDIATAYHSTGIADITTVFEATKQLRQAIGLPAYLRRLLGTGIGKAVLRRQVDKRPEGPDTAALAAGQATIIAVAEADDGSQATAKLTTPAPYALTAQTALEAARRIIAGEVGAGYYTPSQAFGADFITGFAGCTRQDLN